MGLASVWAEYGPARNERARGQNSIYIEGSSPSQTLRIRTILTYSFSEKYFLRSVRGILIKPVSSRVKWEKILRSLSLQVFIDSASRRHPWIPNQVHNIYSFSPLKLCFVF